MAKLLFFNNLITLKIVKNKIKFNNKIINFNKSKLFTK